MDSDTITTILEAQDRAYRAALEICQKQVNEKVNSLETTVRELRRSLEFSQQEVDELQREVKQLEREGEAKKATLQELKNQCSAADGTARELEDRCNYLEDYSRRNNIHITGLEEKPEETWEQTAEQVGKLLADKMQLPNLTLERAHRVGQRKNQRPRPVVARFLRYGDRELVMRNGTKLKGTEIYINDDLCQASQEKKRAQLPLLK